MRRSVAFIAAAVLIGAGCSSGSTKATPEPDFEERFTTFALESAWGDLSRAERRDICDMVDGLGLDAVVDVLKDGLDNPEDFDRRAAKDFFRDVC